MKRILLSLIMVTAVASTAILATRAYFTDTQRNSDNVLGTGTLKVDLAGKTTVSQPEIFKVSNLAPGDTTSGCFQVANTGNMDLVFRAYVERTSATPNDGFMDRLILKSVVINPPDCPIDGSYDRYGPSNVSLPIPSNMTVRTLTNPDNAIHNLSAAYNEGWPLNPGYAATYRITAELSPETGNTYQNAQFTGNLVVNATQHANQDSDNIVW